MSLKQLKIRGISYSQSRTGAFALVLTEVDGNRTLPVVIGQSEAHAIAVVLENIESPRPLTHDLFVTFSKTFNIKLKQVIIHKLIDGVFFSSLIFEKDKVEEIIDSRTSDAIALAVRFDIPVFTYENILDKAGIDMQGEKFMEEQEEGFEEDSFEEEAEELLEEMFSELERMTFTLNDLSDQDLQKKLNEAIENEDYEEAAKLRDELEKRGE